MQHYNRDIRRILITAVVLAALLASTILVAALFSEQPQIVDDDPDESVHTTVLPTAPLTIIIDSGSQGTQIVGNLEFGFLNDTIGYAIGLIEDWLQIHNGFNKTDAIGIGYDEIRTYAFAYLGETRLFDDWENRTEGSSSSSDSVAWRPQEKSSIHAGDIHEGDLVDLTMAGFVIEYESLMVYFKDGTNIVCGPTNLALGVNFTLVDGEWNIEYIFDTSSTDNLVFGTDSVTIQLIQEISQVDDDDVSTNTPVSEQGMILLPVMSIPIILAIAILVVVFVADRRQ